MKIQKSVKFGKINLMIKVLKVKLGSIDIIHENIEVLQVAYAT